MLKQRVITALVLLAILLPALFYHDARGRSALLTLVLIAAAAWEWARLNGFGAQAARPGLRRCVAGCAACPGRRGCWRRAAAAASGGWPARVWVLGGALAAARRRRRLAAHSAGAALAAGPGRCCGWPGWPWRRRAVIGINFLLSVLLPGLGGRHRRLLRRPRASAKRKLAPAISPGKSWEGVWSGMAGVLVLALAWVALDARVATDSASLYTPAVRALRRARLLAGAWCSWRR